MTETEWRECTDARLLVAQLKHDVSERKRTLLGCACLYRILAMIEDKESHSAVQMAEKAFDGANSAEEREQAVLRALGARGENFLVGTPFASDAAFELARGRIAVAVRASAWAVARASGARSGSDKWREAFERENAEQLRLTHDIFGNPFRPVVFDPAWRTSDVLLLARGIYDDRAFDRMPILADALQDAGCDNADVLNHCRDPQRVHVRGCWVVDLVMGKE